MPFPNANYRVLLLIALALLLVLISHGGFRGLN